MSTSAADMAVISARPRVSIAGRARPGLADALLAAQVHLPLAGMAHAELRVVNWGRTEGEARPDFQFNDIELGQALEVHLGEESEATDFSGEITAIEERYGKGAPQIVLLAEDRLHHLARRRRSRALEDQDLEQVIANLASEAGIETDLSLPDHTGTWHQLNESDLAFMLRLTAPLDLSPRIQDGRLRVRDEEQDRAPLALDPADNLEVARLIADLNRQPTLVRVRNWSLANDDEINAERDAIRPAPSGHTAADLLGDLGWASEATLPHPAPLSQAEADALAERGLRRRARAFVHGELLCRGIPGLRSGREVELAGVSARLTGRWLVVDCSHRFDSAGGFRTRLKVERADWASSGGRAGGGLGGAQ